MQESNDSSYVQTPPLVGLESLKVCDIIDQSTGNWNVNAINEIFNNRDDKAWELNDTVLLGLLLSSLEAGEVRIRKKSN